MALSGAIIGLIIAHVSPYEMCLRMESISVGAFMALIMGSALGILVQWRKWQQLVSHVRPATTPSEGLISLLAGFGFGLLTPARLGDIGRGSVLDDQHAPAAAAAVVDRLCSFGVTVFAGIAGITYFEPLIGTALLIAAAATSAGLYVKLRTVRVDQERGAITCLGERAARIIGEIVQALNLIPGSLWLSTVLWSVLFNLLFFAQFVLIASDLSTFSGELAAATPVLFAMKALAPISFLDLGAREGAAVLTFAWLALDPAIGLSAALMVYVTNVLLPALVGWAVIFRWIAPRPVVPSVPAGKSHL